MPGIGQGQNASIFLQTFRAEKCWLCVVFSGFFDHDIVKDTFRQNHCI